MAEQNNATKDQQNEGRKPFRIKLNNPVEFSPIASAIYITSTDLCKLTNEIFKSVFVDCEGSKFEVAPNNGNIDPVFNQPFISVAFNHGTYPEGSERGIELTGKLSNHDVLSYIRYHDMKVTEGDRYSITEDAKDAFMPLLNMRAYNNGNPNWKNIVVEFSEGQDWEQSIYNFSANQRPHGPVQFTKVMFLDPSRICKLIFGDKDSSGDLLDYGVTPVACRNSVLPYSRNNEYILQITRVYNSEINSMFDKFGVSTQSSIIR